MLALEVDVGVNDGTQFLQPGGKPGIERFMRRVQFVDQPCAFGMLLPKSLNEFGGFRASIAPEPRRTDTVPPWNDGSGQEIPECIK